MNFDLLKKLCFASGVSGNEEEIKNVISSVISCDEMHTDKAGNLICTKKSENENAPTLIVDAHMDSVGLCVKEVCERGFLKFSCVGGVDERLLPASTVLVHGKDRDVFGVIATKPPHLMKKEDETAPVSVENMFIDTGDNSEGIEIGDRASYKPHFHKLLSSVSATYLDNRLGCLLIIDLFENLKSEKLPFNLKAVFSIGEEIGLKGAKFGEFDADAAIILDVTFAKTPDEDSDEALETSGGAAVGVGPNLHKGFTEKIFSVATRNNIPCQTEVLEGSSGTNAWMYQVYKLGIPCTMLSVPIKYMHTPVETVKNSDFENTQALLNAFVKSLSEKDIRDVSEVTEIC